MDQWRSDDVGYDEIKKLAKIVVDFNRERGLHEADDDDLLQIAIKVYLLGRAAKRAAWHTILTLKGIVQ